jgi:hypothetical protein
MFITERYRRNPPPRRPPAGEASSPEPDAEQLDHHETTEIDDADEELSDADFVKALRRDVAGVREGVVPSINAAQRPSPKDRPWGRRHKRRDRHGKAF